MHAGTGMMKVLNALSAAYRQEEASTWLPKPSFASNLWPADLQRLLPVADGKALEAFSKSNPDQTCEVMDAI